MNTQDIDAELLKSKCERLKRRVAIIEVLEEYRERDINSTKTITKLKLTAIISFIMALLLFLF